MLARELDYASPARMLSEMSPSELGEWLADYSISPWGEWRSDWRIGQLAALTAEINRNREKKPEPFSTREFMFDYMQDHTQKQEQLGQMLRLTLLGMGNKKAK